MHDHEAVLLLLLLLLSVMLQMVRRTTMIDSQALALAWSQVVLLWPSSCFSDLLQSHVTWAEVNVSAFRLFEPGSDRSNWAVQPDVAYWPYWQRGSSRWMTKQSIMYWCEAMLTVHLSQHWQKNWVCVASHVVPLAGGSKAVACLLQVLAWLQSWTRTCLCGCMPINIIAFWSCLSPSSYRMATGHAGVSLLFFTHTASKARGGWK